MASLWSFRTFSFSFAIPKLPSIDLSFTLALPLLLVCPLDRARSQMDRVTRSIVASVMVASSLSTRAPSQRGDRRVPSPLPGVSGKALGGGLKGWSLPTPSADTMSGDQFDS